MAKLNEFRKKLLDLKAEFIVLKELELPESYTGETDEESKLEIESLSYTVSEINDLLEEVWRLFQQVEDSVSIITASNKPFELNLEDVNDFLIINAKGNEKNWRVICEKSLSLTWGEKYNLGEVSIDNRKIPYFYLSELVHNSQVYFQKGSAVSNALIAIQDPVGYIYTVEREQ